MLVELDRQARSLGSFLESVMELNERFDRLRVTPADVGSRAVDAMLAQLIDNYIC